MLPCVISGERRYVSDLLDMVADADFGRSCLVDLLFFRIPDAGRLNELVNRLENILDVLALISM